MSFLLAMTLLACCQLADTPALVAADDPNEKASAAGEESPTIELSDDVRDSLLPLFQTIAKADVSRVAIELSAESLVRGAVVDSQKSTYQIASAKPDRFTIYLKETDQRTRLYSDGKSMFAALAPDAYVRIKEPVSMQQAVVELPVPLGPYPEPVLALSLAGVDPTVSMLKGMKSVELVDRGKLRGRIPAVHFRGIQDDLVSWDFWISQDEQPKPLRLLVDLTEMLRGTDQVQLPEGFSYQLRFDFLAWRMSGEVDHSLFKYEPQEDAKEYKSLDEYYESIAGVVGEHPLVGKPAPKIRAVTLSGERVASEDFADKVVVLDFWATWCEPCIAAIPVIKQVTDEFSNKDVIFFAVNVGEDPSIMEAFLDKQDWELNVLVDPEAKVSDAFIADAIPQTVVIGKTGLIESVHTGFLGVEPLRQRLTDELEVLSVGGRIGSASNEAVDDKNGDDK